MGTCILKNCVLCDSVVVNLVINSISLLESWWMSVRSCVNFVKKGTIRIYFCLGIFWFDCEVGSDCEAMCSTLYADFVMCRMDVLMMD